MNQLTRQEITPTYYEILEISDENVSIEQIKRQYQKLLLIVDKLGSIMKKIEENIKNNDDNERKIELIIKAWQILKDPELRKVYDEELKAIRLNQDEIYNSEVDLDDMEYNEETKSYSIPCRCSGYHIITEHDLEQDIIKNKMESSEEINNKIEDNSKVTISENNKDLSNGLLNEAIDKKQEEEPQQNLSKNALKRLRRQQKWEETREARKTAWKEKDRKKKEEKRKAIKLGLSKSPPKKPKVESIPSDMKVVIDLSFDELMNDVEISSLTSQLSRCYSANRSATRPVNLYFTSCGGRVQERFNTKLQNYVNWKNVIFESRSYLDCFNKDELIYLTADSNECIQELDEQKIYIIGGLVDKNRHKSICYNKSQKDNIASAQLPIGNYVQLSTRKVLAVNHVFEILIRWLEYKDWEKAFLEVIPQRKFNVGRDEKTDVNAISETT
ncbi:15467_t:CDS:2 [Funneliformis geosporum]|nr:15467_t:CDS:2 [Funneliformis geosporum]